jgi:hypothetical protein
MKLLVLSLTMLAAGNLCMAMDKTIKLPDAAILRTRLCNAGLDHFVEKTKIDTELANKELYPMGVAVAVEAHLYDYNEYIWKQPMIAIMMQMRKPEIIEILLKDHPDAIAKLKTDGIIIPFC